MTDSVNMVKLCVGAERVEDLTLWQRQRFGTANPVHVTRMRPRREADLLNGGSLYWVFRGLILARQRIVGLEERRGTDGILRCALIFDPEVILTEAMPRRAFQGWRYLLPADSPRDLPQSRRAEAALPRELMNALSQIGLR